MASAVTTRIAIIGAGFSGSLLAVALLRRFQRKVRIHLIEKNTQFGCGLAYSAGNPNHLVNVRAGRMSAFADDPDHFVRWLVRHAQWLASGERASISGGPVGPDSFVPRRLYGLYIQDLLGNEIWQTGGSENLHLVPDEAVAIRKHADGLTVELRSGECIEVDGAVLAIGNFPNDDVAAHYYGNPWSPRALAGLDPGAAVLLVGTGLTMVDTVISLHDQGHEGLIYAVSRRGLLPRRHGEAPPHDGIGRSTLRTRALAKLLHDVRDQVQPGEGDESNWRSVVDALRPFTQDLWLSLRDEEKRRFLRHLRPWWDVHRHRMAPAVADLIDRLVDQGRLSVWAARVQAMTAHQHGVAVTLRHRGEEGTKQIGVARVIDCSGPQCDYARIDNALVRDLLAQGMARPDGLGLGLDVTHESAIIDRAGTASRRLYALGPVTRGTFWEITSVPDIREQCWRLATRIEARLPPPDIEAIPPFASVAARSVTPHRWFDRP